MNAEDILKNIAKTLSPANVNIEIAAKTDSLFAIKAGSGSSFRIGKFQPGILYFKKNQYFVFDKDSNVVVSKKNAKLIELSTDGFVAELTYEISQTCISYPFVEVPDIVVFYDDIVLDFSEDAENHKWNAGKLPGTKDLGRYAEYISGKLPEIAEGTVIYAILSMERFPSYNIK